MIFGKFSQYSQLKRNIKSHINWSVTNLSYKKYKNKKTWSSNFSKNYTVDSYEKGLREVKFPNYENFANANDGYSNFIQKLIETIDNLAPLKIEE